MGSNVGRYAKTAVTVVLGGLYALQAALSDGTVTNTEWVAIGLAALTAVGVWAVPNVKAAPTTYLLSKDTTPAQDLTQNSTDQGHNVDWTPVGQGAPAVHLPRRDPLTGRYSKEP